MFNKLSVYTEDIEDSSKTSRRSLIRRQTAELPDHRIQLNVSFRDAKSVPVITKMKIKAGSALDNFIIDQTGESIN